MRYDYLIVGAGLYGATFAQQMTEAGRRCLVVERRGHIGGNAYTELVNGVTVHRYGPHIFHTNDRQIWSYVRRFDDFNRFTNSPMAYYRGRMYSLPFNMLTFSQMWGVVSPEEAAAILLEQRREVPGGAGDLAGWSGHLRKAGEGIHREAMGAPLPGAPMLHHQTLARPADL